MWLNSKKAAEILGIKYGTLVKSINRASKKGKKFCSIRSNILNFKYITGIGGNSGKTLQIWIDDANLSGGNAVSSNAVSSNAVGADRVGGNLVSGDMVSSNIVNSDMVGGDCVDGISLSNNQNLSVSESNASSTQLNLESLETNKKVLNLDDKNAVCDGSHSVGGRECGCVGGRECGCVGDAISPENLGADAIHNNAKFSHLKTLNENQKLEVIAYSKKYSVKKAKKFFGISDKNIYRWLKEFENGGIKEIKDRRGKRIKADLILIKQAILSIGNAHKSSWWMEYVRRFCLTNNLEFNAFNLEADISKSTFYRHANSLIKKDADIRNFLRGGLDGLTDMNLSVKRDYLMENEEWQIDATSFDFMCLNEKGEPQRYTAIGMIDAKSGKRVYELADSPNSYANVRLLKKAFIKMGRPGYIKGDNGKDYIGAHFQGVLARLGVSYIAAAPFKGAQKGVIERSHGVMQNFFEGLSGFIGHNAGHRIKKENEALEKSKRLSGVKTNIKNLLTKDEMQSMIDSWCDKKYGVSKGVDTSWFDERLFGKAYQRVLSASGISINSITYQSLELYKNIKIGSSMEVIEDIDDASKVYVYHKGEFICEIVHSEVKNITAEEVKKAKKEYQKTHITPTKNYIKSLRDEKDAYYKEVAKQNLDEKMKAKNSVIKKESAAKKVEDEDSSSGEIYLPDINEVLKEFVG